MQPGPEHLTIVMFLLDDSFLQTHVPQVGAIASQCSCRACYNDPPLIVPCVHVRVHSHQASVQATIVTSQAYCSPTFAHAVATLMVRCNTDAVCNGAHLCDHAVSFCSESIQRVRLRPLHFQAGLEKHGGAFACDRNVVEAVHVRRHVSRREWWLRVSDVYSHCQNPPMSLANPILQCATFLMYVQHYMVGWTCDMAHVGVSILPISILTYVEIEIDI